MITLESSITQFHMDFFGTQSADCTLKSGYKITLGCTKSKEYQTIEIKDSSDNLIVSRNIYDGMKYEWIHLLNGKLKARFYLYENNTGYLHEAIIPHDIGKKCTVKRV